MFESVLGYQVTVGFFAGLLLVAAVSDIISYKIPNKVVLSIILLYPVLVLVSPHDVDWISGILVASVALAVGFVLFATNKLGAGDAKLIAATMLWAGPVLAPPALLICTLSGGAIALVMLSPARFVIAGALSSLRRGSQRDTFLWKEMPYGVPIALGGLFVAWALLVTDSRLTPLVGRLGIN